MIRAGAPEAFAEMNAQAFSLTAEGDAEWISEDVRSLIGRPAAPSSSSPPTTPLRSRRSADARFSESANLTGAPAAASVTRRGIDTAGDTSRPGDR